MQLLRSALLVSLLSGSPLQAQDGPTPLAQLQAGGACARTIHDDGTGACLEASRIPQLGKLYPLSQDLWVEPGSGRVGLGTLTPLARLHVADEPGAPGVTRTLRVDCDSAAGTAIVGLAREPLSSNSAGVHGQTFASGGVGVKGDNGLSVTVLGSGVCGTTLGHTRSASNPTAGVVGLSWASDTHDQGVAGQTYSDFSGVGVAGFHMSALGTGAGMSGTTFSNAPNANGVVGSVSSASPGSFSAGVRGAHSGTGNLGIGVYGSQAGSGYGVYGVTTGSGYGVVGSTASGGFGVFSFGDLGAGGVKSFVQPHPQDASKEIRFVCLEGNESGTYFRGTSRLDEGRVVIAVPEDFRLVSEATSITVQLTKRGPGDLWVETSDLERIVVRGDGDLAFDYLVNGVRRGFADFETMRDNRTFVPHHIGQPFGEQYPAGLREILVQNGTLRADFTPNEATARRLGWDLVEPSAAPLLPAPPQPMDASGPLLAPAR